MNRFGAQISVHFRRRRMVGSGFMAENPGGGVVNSGSRGKRRFERMTRAFRFLTVVLMVGGFGAAGAAWADSSALKPFFGIYEGSSLAPSAEAQPRDLKVWIKPTAEDGFTVAWQTTLYEPDDGSRLKTQSLDFRPMKNNPSIYEADASGLTVGMVPSKNPLEGAPFAWARVLGKVMSIQVLTIAKNGDYVIQSSDRALTKDGMALAFVKVRNGHVENRLWGALERVGD
jgi:hypothetical protein